MTNLDQMLKLDIILTTDNGDGPITMQASGPLYTGECENCRGEELPTMEFVSDGIGFASKNRYCLNCVLGDPFIERAEISGRA